MSSIPNQSAAAIFSAMGAGVRSPVTPDVLESQQAGAANLNQGANRAIQAGIADQEAALSKEGLAIRKQELDFERRVSDARLKIEEAGLRLQEMLGLKQLSQEKEIADRAQSQRSEEFTAEQLLEREKLQKITDFQNRTLKMDEFQMRREAAIQDLQMQLEIGDRMGEAETRKRLLELDRRVAKVTVASNIASLAATEGREAAAAALLALSVTNQKALEADGVVRDNVAQAVNQAFRAADLNVVARKMDRNALDKVFGGLNKSLADVGDFFTGTEFKAPKENYLRGLAETASTLGAAGVADPATQAAISGLVNEIRGGVDRFANLSGGRPDIRAPEQQDVGKVVQDLMARNPQAASVLDSWADSVLVVAADAADSKRIEDKVLGREIMRVATAVKDAASVASPADTQRLVDELMTNFEQALPIASLQSMSVEEQRQAVRAVSDKMAAYIRRLPQGVREDVDEAVTNYLEGKLGERKSEVDLRGYRRDAAMLEEARNQIETGDADAAIQRVLGQERLMQQFMDTFGADALEDELDG